MPKKKQQEEEVNEEDFEALLEDDEEEEDAGEEVENGGGDSDDGSAGEDELEIEETEFLKELEALNRVRNQKKEPVVYKQSDLALIAEEMKVKMPGGKDLSWEESLSINTVKPFVIEDVQDDLEREKRFYASTLEATSRAVELLHKHKISFRRPTDYFAEMLKSDETMKKIKSNLLNTKKNIEASEDRRKQRDMKKFGKKLQAQKRLEKQDEKKKEKVRVKSSVLEEEGADGFPAASASTEDKKASKKRRFDSNDGQPDSKRKKMTRKDRKAEKFKTPGRRSGDKRNTAESSATFKAPRQSAPLQKKKKAPAKRPGKSQRNNSR
ncbi:hypothetical protein PROFUN_09208 [Planoprotostelium fungivorum]|uniref:rRNA-processing protein EBP2 n=1 Tax=Planoprotostelium fungivorum TaxID=1890364 RepID=A0A2P6NHJ8_9EUKA|nr:hypothetical protein PROFUN_09208 [Planoprotostelium fungivorum]